MRLPFVRRNEDGTLDLWHVQETGNPEIDHSAGRLCAARLTHFYRAFDYPQVAPHIFEAVMKRAKPPRAIHQGFADEGIMAVAHAPANATPGLSIVSAMGRGKDHLDPARFPFVTTRRDGSLDAWDVRDTGDWADDNARGRHFADLTAEVTRRTQMPDFFRSVVASMVEEPARFEGSRGHWTGFLTEVATISTASCAYSTPHKAAALPLHHAAFA